MAADDDTIDLALDPVMVRALEDFHTVLGALCAAAADHCHIRLVVQGLLEASGTLMRQYIQERPDRLHEMRRLAQLLALYIEPTTDVPS